MSSEDRSGGDDMDGYVDDSDDDDEGVDDDGTRINPAFTNSLAIGFSSGSRSSSSVSQRPLNSTPAFSFASSSRQHIAFAATVTTIPASVGGKRVASIAIPIAEWKVDLCAVAQDKQFGFHQGRTVVVGAILSQ